MPSAPETFESLLDQAKWRNTGGESLFDGATCRRVLASAEKMGKRLLGIDGFVLTSGKPEVSDDWIYDASGKAWDAKPAQVYQAALKFLGDAERSVQLFSPTFAKT